MLYVIILFMSPSGNQGKKMGSPNLSQTVQYRKFVSLRLQVFRSLLQKSHSRTGFICHECLFGFGNFFTFGPHSVRCSWSLFSSFYSSWLPLLAKRISCLILAGSFCIVQPRGVPEIVESVQTISTWDLPISARQKWKYFCCPSFIETDQGAYFHINWQSTQSAEEHLSL